MWGEQNDTHCNICKLDHNKPSLLCCDLCPKVFHLRCLDPPLKAVPKGEWHCTDCQKLLAYQDIERIVAVRKAPVRSLCSTWLMVMFTSMRCLIPGQPWQSQMGLDSLLA